MNLETDSDCTDTLLDLLHYEIVCNRLSPEMGEMLKEHLENCPECRRKMLAFSLVLKNEATCPNFG